VEVAYHSMGRWGGSEVNDGVIKRKTQKNSLGKSNGIEVWKEKKKRPLSDSTENRWISKVGKKKEPAVLKKGEHIRSKRGENMTYTHNKK